MPGSVTNPAGSWSGGSLTGLVDAACETWSGTVVPMGGPPPATTVDAQLQHWCLMTNIPNRCSRVGVFATTELTLRGIHVATKPYPATISTYPPAADLPLTFQGDGTPLTTSDGVLRNMKCFARNTKGKDTLAVSGTITLTQMDAAGFAGSYSLNFGSGLCTGAFVAPWCGNPPA